jgi:methylase of polypeptide subunit release factors
LDQIQRLVANAEQWITPGGMMLMEIESSQGESAPSLARKYHPNAQISVQEDLSGHPRLLTIQWN